MWGGALRSQLVYLGQLGKYTGCFTYQQSPCPRRKSGKRYQSVRGCLLYTSDAADEEDSVDLGGRRIIKKK